MSLRISERRDQYITIVDLCGELKSGADNGLFRQFIEMQVRRIEPHLLFNFTYLTGLDAAGLAELTAGLQSIIAAGGVVKLLNVTGRLDRLQSSSANYPLFESFEDEEGALASFARPFSHFPH